MFVEYNFFVGLRDIDFKNNLKIKSLLSYLEDIGGIHSNKVGYGLLDIPTKNRSWVLINWKVKILKRPHYAETLKVKTWARSMDKLYAYRDFEVYNENGQKVVIATSRWVCIDTLKKSICRIDEEMKNAYTVESNKVFEEDIKPIKEPKSFIDKCSVKITKDMIDVNGHVHNLNYIDFVSQILPYEVMQNIKEIEVLYKKEIKENENIRCLYSLENNYNYVTIKSEDEKNLYSIIKIKLMEGME